MLRLDLSVLWPTTELTVGYGPRLSLVRELDGSEPWGANFLHEVDAGFFLRDARYTLGLTQSFSYGTQSFAQIFAVPEGISVAAPGTAPGTSPSALAAAASAAAPVTPVPSGTGDLVPLRSVKYLGYSGGARLTYLFSPRWESNFNADYSVSGGRDGDEDLLPRIHTIDVGGAVEHEVTRQQSVGGVLHSQRGWSERGDFWLAELAASWALRLSVATTLSLRAGLGYRDTGDDGSDTRSHSFSPVGAAGLTHSVTLPGSRALFSLVVTYDPAVDVVNATVQDRITGLASVGWATETDSVTLAVTGSHGFGSDPNRFLGSSLTYDHRFVDWLGVQLGGQVADQDAGAPEDSVQRDFTTGTIWTVFAGVGLTLDPQRF